MDTKRYFFFGLILFLTLPIPLAIGAELNINYWDRYDVLAEDFTTSVDKSSIPGWLDVQVQPPEKVDFTPLQSQKIDENHTLFLAEVVFRTRVTIKTDVVVDDLDIRDSNIKIQWGEFYFCENFAYAQKITTPDGVEHDLQSEVGTIAWGRDTPAYYSWPEITLSHKIMGADVSKYIFNGKIPLNYDFSFDNSTLDFGTDQVVFKNKQFVATLTSAQIETMRDYEVGHYDNVYNPEIDASLRVIPNMGGNAQGDFENTIENLNLGVSAGSTIKSSLLQGINDAAEMGSSLEVIGDKASITGVRLQPEIVQVRQYVKVRSAKLYVDTKTGTLGYSPAEVLKQSPVTTSTKLRTLGYELQNYGQTYTILWKFRLDSLSEVDVKQTSTPVVLVDASTNMSDYYWGNYATGTTGVSTMPTMSRSAEWLNSFGNWWADYWWVVAIVAIALIGGAFLFLLWLRASRMPIPPMYYRYDPYRR